MSRSQRAPLWRGVDEITLACDGHASGVSDSFCAAALTEARRGAPYPIRPADGSGGIATLALRLTLATVKDGRVVTIAGERAVTIDEAQGTLVPRSTRAMHNEKIERTLARAFDVVLPWRRTKAVIQPPHQA